jgi:hypothetical protein
MLGHILSTRGVELRKNPPVSNEKGYMYLATFGENCVIPFALKYLANSKTKGDFL